MPVTITITKTLEDWWGVDDLIADKPADVNAAITELVMEDVAALLDGATWQIEITTAK